MGSLLDEFVDIAEVVHVGVSPRVSSLPERYIPHLSPCRSRLDVGGGLGAFHHVGLAEVWGDCELERSFVGEETERLVVVHGTDVCRVEEIVILDVSAFVGIEDLVSSDTENLLEHVRGLDVETTEKEARTDTSVHDGMSVVLPVPCFELAETLEDDGDGDPPRPCGGYEAGE